MLQYSLVIMFHTWSEVLLGKGNTTWFTVPQHIAAFIWKALGYLSKPHSIFGRNGLTSSEEPVNISYLNKYITWKLKMFQIQSTLHHLNIQLSSKWYFVLSMTILPVITASHFSYSKNPVLCAWQDNGIMLKSLLSESATKVHFVPWRHKRKSVIRNH